MMSRWHWRLCNASYDGCSQLRYPVHATCHADEAGHQSLENDAIYTQE